MNALRQPSEPGSRIVVLGGGNGTSRLLRALVPLLHSNQIASLHALVHMADDGGSTGRLRDQYEVGAMGDLTRCMLALSRLRGDVRGEKFLKALEYRFSEGDFKGHTLRNALLAALELTSDLDAAIATFARVLQIPKYAGVIPVTLTPLTQQVEKEVGGEKRILGRGQHTISWDVDLQEDADSAPGDAVVTFAEQGVPLNPRARQALENATHIIVAPGHTYGTILPTLASIGQDTSFSFKDTQASIIVVMTLLTTPLHTVGWSGEDFIGVYESYIGRPVDIVLANNGRAKVPLVEGQDWVEFKEPHHPYQLIEDDVVYVEEAPQQKGDTVPRPILVHDAERIQQNLVPFVSKQE